MSTKKRPGRINPTIVRDHREALLPCGRHFIRTSSDNGKQHGRILFAVGGPEGPVARVELLSWETGEKIAEVLFDLGMLMQCEFFGDDLASRWLELVSRIRADFLASKKAEVSA